jgi:hypothetical protein
LPNDEKRSVESAPADSSTHQDEDWRSKKSGGGGGSNSNNNPVASRVPRIIPQNLLEKNKKDLRTYLLEKELVSAALTRLYEAEAAKEVTREERETLGAKYRDELKSLDEKILKIDAFIEVGDLETLRDQLVRLVNQKMDSIDKRIEHTRKIAEPLIAQILSENALKQKPPAETREPIGVVKPKVPDISDMLQPEAMTSTPQNPTLPSDTQQKPQEVIVSPTEAAPPLLRKKPLESSSVSDPQVEQLQKELLEALDRLEKLDVESA